MPENEVLSGVNMDKDIEECESFTEKSLLLEPQILKTSAGEESCCIFRVPQSLAERNPGAYEPKVVSIGPYHHRRYERLKMIEEHKPRFLKLFLEKAEHYHVGKSVFFKAVAELENDIRSSYSEGLNHIPKKNLVEMMVRDGCFILTLFLIVTRKIILDENKDPIFTIPWILPSIRSDLLLLENQVPFFVLQILFEKSKIDSSCDINQMIFSFFNYSINKPEKYWWKYKYVKAKHLLDLIRKTYIDKPYEDETIIRKSSSDSKNVSPSILSAKRLRMQGIKFRLIRKEDSVLAISLKKNKLKIPRLILDGFISSFFLNSVAFEQLYTKSSNHITSYVVFMACLLDGEEDATFLTNEKRIIENYYGSELEVSQFFKKINKDILFDVSRSYLEEVFKGINEYTSKSFTGIVAEFRHTHFQSPWTCLSSCAVLVVIIIAALQLLLAFLSYRNDTKTAPTPPNGS